MTIEKPRTIVSHRGTLIENLFFTIYVDRESSIEPSPSLSYSTPLVIARRKVPEITVVGIMPRYVEANVTSAKSSPPERCPNRCRIGGRDHDTGWWGRSSERYDEVSGELNGGRVLGDTFVCADGNFVVTSKLKQQIQASNLRGIELLPFPITLNQSYYRGEAKLNYLQVIGKNCLRRWQVEVDGNLCPLCRKGQIYCSECGWMPVLCQKCFKPAFKEFEYLHEGPECPSKSQKNLTIVDLKDWDGSDFFPYGPGNTMISRHALISLLKAGSAPFIATSVWTCIDDVTPEHKARIDRMLATQIPSEGCEIRLPKAVK